MLVMFAGLALFLGMHSMQILAPVRAGIIGAIGEIPYKIGYSILSLIGLILISNGFVAWKYQEGSAILYLPPVFLSHIALLLMLIAFVIFPAAYLPGYIKKVVKHPMITAVKIWAFAHLLANGDAASVVLFGAFLAWAVVDRISVKRRERAGLTSSVVAEPKAWADAAAVVIGVGVYVLFVWKLHLWLIGVPPIVM